MVNHPKHNCTLTRSLPREIGAFGGAGELHLLLDQMCGTRLVSSHCLPLLFEDRVSASEAEEGSSYGAHGIIRRAVQWIWGWNSGAGPIRHAGSNVIALLSQMANVGSGTLYVEMSLPDQVRVSRLGRDEWKMRIKARHEECKEMTRAKTEMTWTKKMRSAVARRGQWRADAAGQTSAIAWPRSWREGRGLWRQDWAQRGHVP
ncbi:hypothetical protein HAX54_016446 [Datura stramonium]|uniref:Uncharacterized protein n=1 Tax=Datura stramonium TaxID=4076 RepID=A0ABS8UJK6_DATST|nr:hypothetical protein [Datura stramonium]